MGLLKDMLSDSSVRNLVNHVKRGDVVRMKLTEKEKIVPKNEGDDGRNKYFIVLGKSCDEKLIGFVVINTNINEHLGVALKNLHYPLRPEKYPFLQKTRYAYCGELKEITLCDFSKRYQFEIFQNIEDCDMEYIIDAVISSPIETKKHLQQFGLIE